MDKQVLKYCPVCDQNYLVSYKQRNCLVCQANERNKMISRLKPLPNFMTKQLDRHNNRLK